MTFFFFFFCLFFFWVPLWYIVFVYEKKVILKSKFFCIVVFFFFFFFCFFCFWAAPVAYGSSQTRGQIKARAISLHHSFSNVGCKVHLHDLHHSSPQHQILNPLSRAWDRTLVLMDTNWVRWSTMGTPGIDDFWWRYKSPGCGIQWDRKSHKSYEAAEGVRCFKTWV